MRSALRRLLCALALVSAVLPLAPARADHDKPDLDEIDPVRFSLSQAVVDRRMITARDGLTSLALDIIRPNTTEPVPTIFLQSPYYSTLGRGYKAERKPPWTQTAALNPPTPWAPFPEWYDEYFVPRGYAIVLQDQRGTRNSSGCQVYGGREEITDAVDVIEWIARQPWSNGAVGMTGGSYDGTIATGAASMAPPALKAIIPIRSIDRWYEYHHFNGVPSSQHAGTAEGFTVSRPMTDLQSSQNEDPLYGAHVAERRACAASVGALVAASYKPGYQDARSDFWAGRDFLKDASKITAATFIIHGLNDTNVKTIHAGHLWAALPEATPKKIWWLRGGHDDPANPSLQFPLQARFFEHTHRWYARYLKGIDTGVEDEGAVSVQGEDGTWTDGLTWPPPGSDRTLYLTPTGLSDTATEGTLTYTDGVATPVAGGTGTAGSSITLDGPVLNEDLRVAGQAYVRLRYALSRGGDTTFSYRLLDVPPTGSAREIASAYARGAYREQIAFRGPSYPTLPQLHEPGKAYDIAFPFVHQDYVVPEGHRLRLIVRADDERVTAGGNGSDVTLTLGGLSALVVPDSASRETEDLKARCTFHPTLPECEGD